MRKSLPFFFHLTGFIHTDDPSCEPQDALGLTFHDSVAAGEANDTAPVLVHVSCPSVFAARARSVPVRSRNHGHQRYSLAARPGHREFDPRHPLREKGPGKRSGPFCSSCGSVAVCQIRVRGRPTAATSCCRSRVPARRSDRGLQRVDVDIPAAGGSPNSQVFACDCAWLAWGVQGFVINARPFAPVDRTAISAGVVNTLACVATSTTKRAPGQRHPLRRTGDRRRREPPAEGLHPAIVAA